MDMVKKPRSVQLDMILLKLTTDEEYILKRSYWSVLQLLVNELLIIEEENHPFRYIQGEHNNDDTSVDNRVCEDPPSSECVDAFVGLPSLMTSWIDATYTNETANPKVRFTQYAGSLR